MTERVQATATAGFGPDSGSAGNVSLSIEGDPGAYSDDVIHLLLFPSVAAQVYADVGSVALGIEKLVPVPGGILQFSGGMEATLPKQPVGVPIFRVLFAFPADNKPAGMLGIGFSFVDGALRATRPCYAAVSYSGYTTPARELRYTPKGDPLPGGGIVTTFGTLAAFYPPSSITTYQVQPFNVLDGDSDFEMYRIVSSAVTTSDGEFEKPLNFPTSGTYAGKALVIDTAAFLETERVHEIGRMDANGRAYVATYYVANLEPYVGDPAYKPVKILKESTLPAEKFPPDKILAAKAAVARRGQGRL